MTKPKITILFATYNGANTLPVMMDALLRLRFPRGAWHIVAVDNNSRDATAASCRGMRGGCRSPSCPKPGRASPLL